MDGTAYIFHWEYPVFVEEDATIDVVEKTIDGVLFRFYAPFQDKDVAFRVASQSVSLNKVPFRKDRVIDRSRIVMMPSLLCVPVFANDAKGISYQHKLVISDPNPNKKNDKSEERRMPADSLRIDCYHSDKEVADKLINDLHEKLMTLLRWRTQQWWITRSGGPLSSGGPQQFKVGYSGNPLWTQKFQGGLLDVYGFIGVEKEVDSTIWKQALTDLDSNTQIPISDLLIMDATYFHAIRDIRQAVLNAHAACEQVKELVFAVLWEKNNPGRIFDSEQREKKLRTWNLPKHLDENFQSHFRRSYKAEHPTEWELIDKMYEARNNIAHGGKTSIGNPSVEVDTHLVRKFIEASRHCMTWLQSL